MGKIAYAPVGIPRSVEGLKSNGLFVGHHLSYQPEGQDLYISADVPGVCPVFVKPYSTQDPDDYYLLLIYPYEESDSTTLATLYITYYGQLRNLVYPGETTSGYHYESNYKVGVWTYYANNKEHFDTINHRIPVVSSDTEAYELVAGNPWLEEPYGYGGYTGPGVPDGRFDFDSTVIPVPTLPNIGAFNTGFVTLFSPSAADLKTLASYLWAGAFDISNFRKIVANPMDTILGLHIIPIISGHPTSVQGELMVGNISTQIYTEQLTEQYYELDCGTIEVPYKWGSYLDFSPYTSLSLYLPYIGMVSLSPDDCMDGSIKVVYHVDVLSGSCIAFVYCISNHGKDGHVLYTFTGNCACDCPVTAGQYENALLAGANTLMGFLGSSKSIAGIVGGLGNAANAALNMVKPDVARSGQFGGSAGLMGIQYPYLILTVPRMAIAEDQYKYTGYPSYMTKLLSDVHGYCEVEILHLEDIGATKKECDELYNILRGGAIL